MDDEALAVRAAQGDERAFAELVERHLSGVYSFCVRYVGDPHEAEDLAQETFFKAWRGLAKYNSKAARFKTWLMRIARNSAVDFLRKKKAVPFSSFDTGDGNALVESLADDAALAEETLAQAHDERELAAALRELAPAYREVLILYYGDDLTFEEVAAALNTSVNTVKSRHRRAILLLRKALPPRT